MPAGSAPVSLRRIPHPYRAVLAICSDLDETPDRQVYWQIMRFLNTNQQTPMGPGVGLEVGNTIYFDMPPDQFAYWNTDEAGREMVRSLVRSGHIDCFHSYGDLATSRSHAGRALDELARHGCTLGVWIDHATAPSNFGADIMRGQGDVPGSAVYHADLTCGFGVKYVWRGRVTSVIGQDVPRRLAGIWTAAHPLASARTAAKEALKGALGSLGSAKYAIHAPNAILRDVRLRDGRPVREFLRANPYWMAVDAGETAEGLSDVLVRPMLERLIERGGACILYTHLGKVKDRREPLGPRTRAALGLLAALQREGKLLVTTTRRLLDLCAAVRDVSLSERAEGVEHWIDLRAPDPKSLAGLTIDVPAAERVRVRLEGREVEGLRRNAPDHTGRPSVSLPWHRLEFPRLDLSS
jgi:hypothetical protein